MEQQEHGDQQELQEERKHEEEVAILKKNIKRLKEELEKRLS